MNQATLVKDILAHSSKPHTTLAYLRQLLNYRTSTCHINSSGERQHGIRHNEAHTNQLAIIFADGSVLIDASWEVFDHERDAWKDCRECKEYWD